MGCYSTFVWFSLLPAVRLAWGAVNQTVGRGSREKCRLLAGTCSFCLTIVRLRHTPTQQVIGDKLDKMDPSTFEPRACELLHGLGFTKQMMQKAERTARDVSNIDTICIYLHLFATWFFRQSQNDLLRWQGCFVHYAPQGTTHTYIYISIIHYYILVREASWINGLCTCNSMAMAFLKECNCNTCHANASCTKTL